MGREKGREITAIGDLTRISACTSIAIVRERGSNLGETLEGRTPPGALVFCQDNLLLFPTLRVLDPRLDGHDLVVEPPGLLRHLSSPIALRRKSILRLPRDVEVFPHILRCLTHWLHAIGSFLIFKNFFVKGFRKTVAAAGHQFCTNSEAAFDAAGGNLVCDVLHSF